MSSIYIADQYFKTFEQPDQTTEYDNCTFENCIFSGFDLSDFSFEECVFKNCDFSNAKINNTAFKTARFEGCKLIGLQFDECNPFLLAFQFIGCQLNLSGFYRVKMKNTFFKECILHEVDFTEAKLTGSTFENCDFTGTMFGNTNLEKVDLTTAFNFIIDPELNQVKGAKFSLQGLPGLLTKYEIKIN